MLSFLLFLFSARKRAKWIWIFCCPLVFSSRNIGFERWEEGFCHSIQWGTMKRTTVFSNMKDKGYYFTGQGISEPPLRKMSRAVTSNYSYLYIFLYYIYTYVYIYLGFLRHGFDPWVKKIPWRRKMAPHSSILALEAHGQRSLAGCSPWGHTESDMT